MENQERKKRRVLPWAIAGSLMLVLSVLAFVLFTPLDLTRFNDRIEAAIESTVSGDIEIGRLVVRVLPSPEVEVAGLAAFHKGELLFKSDRLKVQLSLMPLLGGRAVVNLLEISSPEVVLRRDGLGRMNLAAFLEKEEPGEEEDGQEDEDEADDEEGRRFFLKALDLKGGSFSFIDRLPSEGADFEAVGVRASVKAAEGGYSFAVGGTLLPSTPLAFSGRYDRKGAADWKGSVKGLMLSVFNPYIRERSPGASVEAKVDIDLSYASANGKTLNALVTYAGLKAEYPSTFAQPLASRAGSGRVTLSAGEELDLKVDDIKIEMEEFSAAGRFALGGPKGSLAMRIEASTTPVPLAVVRSLIPVKAMEAAPKAVPLARPLSGSVTVARLILDAPVSEFKGAGVLMKPGGADISVSLSGISLAHKSLKKPLKDISGDIALKDGNLTLSNFSGSYGQQRVERLSGRVRELGGAAPFELSLEGTMDIAESLAIAKEIGGKAISGKLARAEATGSMALKARLSGSVKGKAPLKYSGEASVKGGSIAYEGAPVNLRSIKARLSFDNERLRLIESSANVGQSDLELSGELEGYRGKDPAFSLKAAGGLAGDLIATMARKSPGDVVVDGRVPFSVQAEGRRDSFSARASADATTARVLFLPYLDKAAGFPLKARAQGWRKADEAGVKEAVLEFGTSSASAAATARADRSAYSLSLLSEQILIADLDEVSPYLNREYASSGALHFNVRTEKRSAWDKPVYSGSVGIRDGRFETDLISSPVENINARAQLEGNRASLIVDEVSTGSTRMRGTLDVLDIAARSVNFAVEFPALRASDLMPRKKEEKEAPEPEKGEQERPEPEKEGPNELARINGSGSIKMAEADLWGHRLSSFSTGVTMDAKGVHLRPMEINIEKGQASGSASYFTDSTEPLLFVADMNISNIDLESMIAAFGAKKKVLSGNARGDVLVSLSRGASPALAGLNGRASFYSDKGRLWKFGFLSDIFAIVNIISIDKLLQGGGMPYKGIQGTFDLTDGIISTDDLYLDSDTLRMSGVGSIDLPGSSIDATVALHPFVTIDKIISNIPLAGWIIAGEHESLVSLYFGVKGDLKDPTVLPMPVKSIRKNVFGILERLLKAPFKLFD